MDSTGNPRKINRYVFMALTQNCSKHYGRGFVEVLNYVQNCTKNIPAGHNMNAMVEKALDNLINCGLVRKYSSTQYMVNHVDHCNCIGPHKRPLNEADDFKSRKRKMDVSDSSEEDEKRPRVQLRLKHNLSNRRGNRTCLPKIREQSAICKPEPHFNSSESNNILGELFNALSVIWCKWKVIFGQIVETLQNCTTDRAKSIAMQL